MREECGCETGDGLEKNCEAGRVLRCVLQGTVSRTRQGWDEIRDARTNEYAYLRRLVVSILCSGVYSLERSRSEFHLCGREPRFSAYSVFCVVVMVDLNDDSAVKKDIGSV